MASQTRIASSKHVPPICGTDLPEAVLRLSGILIPPLRLWPTTPANTSRIRLLSSSENVWQRSRIVPSNVPFAILFMLPAKRLFPNFQ